MKMKEGRRIERRVRENYLNSLSHAHQNCHIAIRSQKEVDNLFSVAQKTRDVVILLMVRLDRT